MIRSILVAIHDSRSARHALGASATLAHDMKARLHGIFVEDPARLYYVPLTSAASASLVGGGPMVLPLPPRELLEEEERMQQEEADLARAFQRACQEEGLAGQFHCLTGDAAENILKRSRSVDLLVLGCPGWTHGIGPMSETVIRSSARPVLVVPTNGRPEGPILMAYDGSPAAQRALRSGAEWTTLERFFGVHLVLVDDDEPRQDRHQREVGEYLSAYEVEMTVHRRTGDPAEAIHDIANEIQAGLIVMGAFGENRLKEMVFGSTTRDVLEKTRCNVLLQG